MRKIQTNPNLYPKSTITAIGDSQTNLTGIYGNSSARMWNPVLSEKLKKLGALVKSRTFGISGQTTAQCLGRADILFLYDTPTIGIIAAGVNDVQYTETGICPANGSSNIIYTASIANGGQDANNSWYGSIITITGGTGSGQTNTIIGYSYDATNNRGVATVLNAWSVNPTTSSNYSIAIPTSSVSQANLQALIKVLKYKAIGAGGGGNVIVYNPSNLPAFGQEGQRYVVMNDNSTTGGLPRTLSTQNATISGDFSVSIQQTVWEYRNPQAGVVGWGRVAITGTTPFSDGCSKIILNTTNYQNFATGGDSYNVTTGTGTKYAPYVPVVANAVIAASAEGIVLCDTYAFQSMTIYGGTFQGQAVVVEDSQGSNNSQILSGSGNHHMNNYGQEQYARAFLYTILNQGWLPGLQS